MTELNASKWVGYGCVFDQWGHESVTHLGYFKPPVYSFLSDLKTKDRRSAKKSEYISAAAV